MTTTIEYALMAGASNISNRSGINKFPVPDGWVEKIDKRQGVNRGQTTVSIAFGLECERQTTAKRPPEKCVCSCRVLLLCRYARNPRPY